MPLKPAAQCHTLGPTRYTKILHLGQSQITWNTLSYPGHLPHVTYVIVSYICLPPHLLQNTDRQQLTLNTSEHDVTPRP